MAEWPTLGTTMTMMTLYKMKALNKGLLEPRGIQPTQNNTKVITTTLTMRKSQKKKKQLQEKLEALEEQTNQSAPEIPKDVVQHPPSSQQDLENLARTREPMTRTAEVMISTHSKGCEVKANT